MTTEVAVAPARPEQCTAIAELFDELGSFYGARNSEAAEQRMDRIRDALFASPPAAYALLAFTGKRLAGFACYSFLWPAAGCTRSLFLKELYVAEACRGEGVGALLMDAIRLTAIEHGCSRVEWTTDDNNLGAMRFTKRWDTRPSRPRSSTGLKETACGGRRGLAHPATWARRSRSSTTIRARNRRSA